MVCRNVGALTVAAAAATITLTETEAGKIAEVFQQRAVAGTRYSAAGMAAVNV